MKASYPPIILLYEREQFWARVKSSQGLSREILSLISFILISSALYGAVIAGWRSPVLVGYVAIKFPLLLLGTTGIVAILNWMLAVSLGSGMTFQQVIAVTYGAMTVACWILLGLTPVTLFFTACASTTGTPTEIQLTHNYLLLTHITLIAVAGIAGNTALRRGLALIVLPHCAIRKLYWSWLMAFALVGCQLSWILRPFVGSPSYPIVFMRANCFERNFYEFVFFEVLPYVLKGGKI
jgi:hypothetical protein